MLVVFAEVKVKVWEQAIVNVEPDSEERGGVRGAHRVLQRCERESVLCGGVAFHPRPRLLLPADPHAFLPCPSCSTATTARANPSDLTLGVWTPRTSPQSRCEQCGVGCCSRAQVTFRCLRKGCARAGCGMCPRRWGEAGA